MNLRNAVAGSVFLFGTTFLWMTPAVAGRGAQPLAGARWAVVQVLVWLSILGFAVAAWGILKCLDWYLPVLAASAVVGVGATVAFLVAVRGTEGVANVASNVVVHAGVSALILLAVAAPTLRHGITGRL